MAEKSKHISLSLCIFTTRQALHPLVILSLKQLPTFSSKVLNFYTISESDAGFMTKEI
jgi:hypothetical protein